MDIVKDEIIMLVGDKSNGPCDGLPFIQNAAFFGMHLETVINSELKRLGNDSEMQSTIDISSETEEVDDADPLLQQPDANNIVLINNSTNSDQTDKDETSLIAQFANSSFYNDWKSYNPNKRKYELETAPAKKKRIVNRLLRNMSKIADEYSVRVGQQIVVCVMSDDSVARPKVLKIFGADPLRQIIKQLSPKIIDTYESLRSINQGSQDEKYNEGDPTLFYLPELLFDGIQYTLDKMTQAQLRAFIPHMLKYSTGRGKPGWGKELRKPAWWPQKVPWANVRCDVRNELGKASFSWTDCLRLIVSRCYKYHGRDDLLLAVTAEETAIKYEEIEKDTNVLLTNLHTIKNSDGTFSIIQVDPQNPIITLPDGSIAFLETIDVDTTDNGQETVEIAL